MKNKKKILFVFGTRPEAIKLAPLIRILKKDHFFNVHVCLTSQHKKMLSQVMNFFEIQENFDLNIMKQNQDLYDVTIKVLHNIRSILQRLKPDLVILQGDTTSSFVAGLAAFYQKIPIAHVEAGLRTYNKYQPFPEEINRTAISSMADLHFAPTLQAKYNLKKEGIKNNNVFITGNTIIDALLYTCKKIKNINYIPSFFKKIYHNINKKNIILVTGHRRESFGRPLREICLSLKEIAKKFKQNVIIYPVHLNPNVRKPVLDILKKIENIHLIEPLSYPDFIWLLKKSHFVVTDSGGLQEEAAFLGKPVLVMRDVTERPEGISCGVAKLTGTNKNQIINNITKLLLNEKIYSAMSKRTNVYGNGKASIKIKNILKKYFKNYNVNVKN